MFLPTWFRFLGLWKLLISHFFPGISITSVLTSVQRMLLKLTMTGFTVFSIEHTFNTGVGILPEK